MKQLVIIGGGFSGLQAAFSAVRKAKILKKQDNIKVTLINKDPYHGLRPRFYEANLDDARISLEAFLHPLGVSFLTDEVKTIDHISQKVKVKLKLKSESEINYDRLIIAAGSKLTVPQGRFAGNNAVASLFNDELLMYEQLKLVRSLDLDSWGALYTEGWDQRLVSIKDEAKKIKLFINHDRIYPPEIQNQGIDTLLAASEPAFKPIKL